MRGEALQRASNFKTRPVALTALSTLLVTLAVSAVAKECAPDCGAWQTTCMYGASIAARGVGAQTQLTRACCAVLPAQ